MAQFKVMYVVHSLGIGGVEKLIYEIVKGVKSRDIEPLVCCLDYPGELGEGLRKGGYKIFALERKRGIDYSIFHKISDILIKEKPDILHAHQYTPYFYTILSSLSFQRLKVIFTEHGRFFPDKVRPNRVIFNQFAKFFTDSITGVCEFTKKSLVKYEKFPTEKIEVIYNGIRTEEFLQGIDVKEKKSSLGIAADAKIIGGVGRLCKEKNYAMLIRAFSEVKKRIENVKLLIVGEGESRGELEKLTEDIDLQKDTIFLGKRQDVPELMKIFNVFALSSDLEAASLVLLEAMASGLPVVATAVGGNPELVEDGKSGTLVPRGDHVKFSEAILDILKNSEKAKNMSRAGRQRVVERFSFDRMVDRYIGLYKKLI